MLNYLNTVRQQLIRLPQAAGPKDQSLNTKPTIRDVVIEINVKQTTTVPKNKSNRV